MTPNLRYCAKCGAVLTPDMRFCQICGTPVTAVLAQAAPYPIGSPPPPRPKNRTGFPWVLAILAGVVVCCVGAALVGGGLMFFRSQSTVELPAPEQIVPVETESLQIVTLTPVETVVVEQPTPTEALPTSMPTAEGPQSNVEFEGVSFYLDPRIASGISGEVIPAMSEADEPMFGPEPEHIILTFDGYTLTDKFHRPQMIIYPILDFAAINPEAGKIVGELRQVLAKKPTVTDHLPLLPRWPAAQYMQAQINYLSFQNGTGVRFLTQYGQDSYPVNNDNMFYTFQGLTKDGAYYVALILPASNPALPPPESVPQDQAFYDNFTSYILETEQMLDSLGAGSYTPDLELLDEMVESIQVK